MSKLEGKAAIVTGATSGMGRAIAGLFAREGCAVVLSGRNEERGREVVQEIEACGTRARFISGDVARLEVNERLVEECLSSFGRLDVVSTNAGSLGLGSLTEVSLSTWRETVAVNLDSVFFLLRCAIPAMRANGGGTIVVTGSIAGLKAFPNHAAYCASKGALISLVRQVAVDYGPAIRINLLCPGPVDTPLIWDSAAAFPNPSRAVADVAERTLMKRLGHPEDIARAALFLASEDSSWITGSALTIDGGIMTGQ